MSLNDVEGRLNHLYGVVEQAQVRTSCILECLGIAPPPMTESNVVSANNRIDELNNRVSAAIDSIEYHNGVLRIIENILSGEAPTTASSEAIGEAGYASR